MTTKILGVAGSLRDGSYNRAVLRTAQEVAPDGVEMDTFHLAPIPMYNADVERDLGFPAAVRDFRERIREADGLLIVTPEYNHSIPGVLKNALEWASRSHEGDPSPLSDKPLAIMSAATGGFGGVRAQKHLEQVASAVNLRPLNRPIVAVPFVADKVENGRVVDEPTRGFIRDQLEAFVTWIERLRALDRMPA